MRYKVMIDCRDGTSECTTRGWEPRYHIITWFCTDDLQEAMQAAQLQQLNPVQVRNAWVEDTYN